MPDEVPSDAIVVRGGIQRDAGKVLEMILDNLDMTGSAVLSVHAGVQQHGESRESALVRLYSESRLPHGKFQLSSARAIRAAGFQLEWDSSKGQAETHCHVIFKEPVTVSDVQLFVDTFSEPVSRSRDVSRPRDGAQTQEVRND